jgi:hypothetical protein
MGSKSFMRATAGLGLALILLLGLTGCSSRGTVSGKVTYRKQSLGGGTVIFYSEGKGTFRATIKDDGTYTIADLPTGTVRIAVVGPTVNTGPGNRYRKVPKGVEIPEESKDNPLYGPAQKSSGKKGVKLPERYGDPDKSQLTYEVISGQQTKDLPLD